MGEMGALIERAWRGRAGGRAGAERSPKEALQPGNIPMTFHRSTDFSALRHVLSQLRRACEAYAQLLLRSLILPDSVIVQLAVLCPRASRDTVSDNGETTRTTVPELIQALNYSCLIHLL